MIVGQLSKTMKEDKLIKAAAYNDSNIKWVKASFGLLYHLNNYFNYNKRKYRKLFQ